MKKYKHNINSIIDEDNYFLNTRGKFIPCLRPKRKPDYISYTKVWVDDWTWKMVPSSEYWYTPQGVVRCSSHWSNYFFGKDQLSEKEDVFIRDKFGDYNQRRWRIKNTKYNLCYNTSGYKNYHYVEITDNDNNEILRSTIRVGTCYWTLDFSKYAELNNELIESKCGFCKGSRFTKTRVNR